ncbi:TPA: hypothetical protein ACWMH2_000745 [Proteus mirabilis]|uniref:tail fiber/spike domain-containing protein n=1 Tax=Proteus mirabilis TaxID=584 RepID=UPI00209EF43A|nr:hypothetical protein [Proteus mirabilis]
MTVSTELSHEEYVGNGVTTDFDFRFRIFESRHLIVVVADNDGNETTLKNGTDYTIVGAGSFHGGKVVLNKPLAKGWKILLERDLPVVQETDLRNQGKFFAEVHEDAFDYLTMLIQKALGTFSLSLRKPTYLSNYYDAKGNHIANLAPPKLGTDAANKDYVDNSIKDIDSKTLRVKDKPIPALPSAEQRRNKQLGFDNEGYPQLLDPAETGSLGYVLVDSFEKGAEITARYQALHFENNGEYYRWDGELPKSVLVNSTPENSGGIGIGKWVSVGSAALNQTINEFRRNICNINDFYPISIEEKISIGDIIPSGYSHIRTEYGSFRIQPLNIDGKIEKFNYNSVGIIEYITVSGKNILCIPLNTEISPDFSPYPTLSDKVMGLLNAGIEVNLGPYIFKFEKPVNLPITNSTIPKIRGVGNRTKIYASFDSSTDSIFQFKGNGNDWVRGVDIGDFEFINPHKNQTGLIDINQCLRGINISNITGLWCPRGIKLTKSYGAGSLKNIRTYLYDSVEFNHIGTYGIICESNAISADTIETVGGYEIGQRWRGDSIFVSNWNSAGADNESQNGIRKAIEINGRQVVQLRSGYIERPYVPTGENINNVIMAEFNDTDQLDVDGINLGAGSIDVKNCRGKVGGLFFGTISNGITYDDKCEIIEGLITHYDQLNTNRTMTGSYWGKHTSGNITRLFDYNNDGFIPYSIKQTWKILDNTTSLSLGMSKTNSQVDDFIKLLDINGLYYYRINSPMYQGFWVEIKELEANKLYTIVIMLKAEQEDTKCYWVAGDGFNAYKPALHYATNYRLQKCYFSVITDNAGSIKFRVIHDNANKSSFRFYGMQINRGVSDSLLLK